MKRFHGKYLIVVEIFIFLIVIASQDISVEKKNPAGKSNEASVRTESVKNSHIVFSSWTLG